MHVDVRVRKQNQGNQIRTSEPRRGEKDRFPRSLASAENGFSDRGGFQGGGLRATKTSPAPEGDGRFCRASLAESETSVGSAVSFIPV